jgi:hypothetical protein
MTTQTLHLPCDRELAEYLTGGPFDTVEAKVTPTTRGTMPLDAYVRFTRHQAPGHGKVTVDVRADGAVHLAHWGRKHWRVIFESSGTRLSIADVPTAVIIAAVSAALYEE